MTNWLCTYLEETFRLNHVFSEVLSIVLLVVLIVLAAFIAYRIKNHIYNRFEDKTVRTKYINSLVTVLIIWVALLGLVAVMGYGANIGRALFGSAGIMVAIIGFAGQSVIADVVAGMMLGWSHPFRLNDRIMLQSSGISGTIRDITIRHVVIHQFDGIYVIVPNSELAKEIITNNSYNKDYTASYLEIPISYDSDVKRAMRIVHNVVVSSRYTIPYKEENPEGKNAAVYLHGYADSALVLRTIVWTHNSDDNYMACSEIRMKVKEEFEKNGIEIPYSFLNVVDRTQKAEPVEFSDIAEVDRDASEDAKIERMLNKIDAFSKANDIKGVEAMRLRLVSEEMISMIRQAVGTATNIDMWPRIIKRSVEIRFMVNVDEVKTGRLSLIAAGNRGLLGKIQSIVREANGKDSEWSMKEEQKTEPQNLEKSIIEKYSDDIRIAVKNKKMIITLVRNLKINH